MIDIIKIKDPELKLISLLFNTTFINPINAGVTNLNTSEISNL